MQVKERISIDKLDNNEPYAYYQSSKTSWIHQEDLNGENNIKTDFTFKNEKKKQDMIN